MQAAPAPAAGHTVAGAGAVMRTAGMPAYPRVSRRGGPAMRQPAFNLLSGETLGMATTPPPAQSVAAQVVWEGGCGYLKPAAEETACAGMLPAAVVATPPLAPRPSAPACAGPAAAEGAAPAASASVGLMPFARDDDLSRRSNAAMAPLEKELMQLSMHKDRLEREYARMPITAGRTAAERREKALLETRLQEIAQQMSRTKAQLRTLQPLRR